MGTGACENASLQELPGCISRKSGLLWITGSHRQVSPDREQGAVTLQRAWAQRQAFLSLYKPDSVGQALNPLP